MPARIDEVVQFLRGAALRQEDGGPTDGQLLGRFIERRDQAAVTALVRRHGPMVWGVCRRILRCRQDAEDAFQATFLVLVRKAGSVRRREMVANWLYGVAHQTALKARAMLARRQARERQAAVPETEAPQQAAPWPDLHPLLDEELSRLPEKYRVAIVLCDLEGKTRKEGARQLGCPEGTLAGRLTRGRAMLAKRLARRGVAVSGGALALILSRKASASVPASVVSATIKAASLFAGGPAAAGAISAKVAALTEGVLKAMFLTKLRMVTVLLLVVLGLAAGGWALSTPAALAFQGPPDQSAVGARKDAQASESAANAPDRVGDERGKPQGTPLQMPVPVVLGPKAFRDGDVIEITDVRATSPKLEQGDSVTVHGRVRLASHDQAQLALYLTQTEGDGREEGDPSQTMLVKRGGGDFELRTTIRHRGFLHLTLYDQQGQPFGGVYFGTARQMKQIENWSLEYYLSGQSRPPTPAER
jgi:RNA polymerase sigma factor (sigma-70 family)